MTVQRRLEAAISAAGAQELHLQVVGVGEADRLVLFYALDGTRERRRGTAPVPE